MSISQNLQTNEPADLSQLAETAVNLAQQLLKEAQSQKTSAEHSQAQKIARMMDDPLGKELTIALVDQAFRSHHPDRSIEGVAARREIQRGLIALLLLARRDPCAAAGAFGQHSIIASTSVGPKPGR